MQEEERQAIAVVPQSTELSVDAVLGRLSNIEELMRRAMRPGVDYGQIPGTSSRPTLLKAGAEKLCLMFRFAPRYKTERRYSSDDAHLTVESVCQIYACDGMLLGEASAVCSTRESKYAYRRAERVCPKCGKAAIIAGKAEYGGGFVCWKKKDGCGANFISTDPKITSQSVGRIPNEDVPDLYNTVLRIAEKRAYIAAVRLVTGCSSIFDEEMPKEEEEPHHEKPEKPPAKANDYPELQDWARKIAALDIPESFTDAISKLPADEALRHTVKRMLWVAAKEKGLAWNDEAKKFEFPCPQVPA